MLADWLAIPNMPFGDVILQMYTFYNKLNATPAQLLYCNVLYVIIIICLFASCFTFSVLHMSEHGCLCWIFVIRRQRYMITHVRHSNKSWKTGDRNWWWFFLKKYEAMHTFCVHKKIYQYLSIGLACHVDNCHCNRFIINRTHKKSKIILMIESLSRWNEKAMVKALHDEQRHVVSATHPVRQYVKKYIYHMWN